MKGAARAPAATWVRAANPAAAEGRPVKVALAASGEHTPDAAFEALMRAHYGRLCNFAYGLVHSRDVAEDIVQDVFARLWNGREEIDVREPLHYLYQAVRNRVVSHRRHQGVQEGWRQYVATAADQPQNDGGAAAAVEAADLTAAFTRALGELPERCRLVFLMSRDQGLTYAEIALALDISIKTVETQIGRALKALRLRLGPYLSLAITAVSSSRLLA
jgi:RNA polymerase sigma-70 factor (ECF subfamily)